MPLRRPSAPRSAPRQDHRHVANLAFAAVVALALTLTACAGTGGALRPGAPTDLRASPADGQVEVGFTPGPSGGSPVTKHQVSIDDGATWADADPPTAAGPIAVGGLTNGDTYPLRLRAVNAVGIGPASARLDVTPIARSFALRFGGSDNDHAADVALFPDGSAVVIGNLSGDATLASSTGDSVVVPGSGGRAVLARVDAGGRIPSPTPVVALEGAYLGGVRATALGGAVIAGSFGSSLDLGPAGVLTSDGTMLFVAAIDGTGTWTHALQATSASVSPYAVAFRVDTLDDGRGVVSGEFSGTLTFGDTTLTSAGSIDGFVAGFDVDGAWRWATRVGGAMQDLAYGVVALPDGGALSVGWHEGPATFGSGEHQLDPVGYSAGYVGRIDANGTWTWVRRATGTTSGSANSVAPLDDGSFVVSGSFEGDGQFDGIEDMSATVADAFVGRIAADGTWQWVVGIGASGPSWVDGLAPRDGPGDVLVAGTLQVGAAFGDTGGIVGAGAADAFVAALDLDGAWRWATRIGGTGNDGASAVGTAPDGDALVVGSFSATVPVADGVELASAGGRDGFIVKIGSDGAP